MAELRRVGIYIRVSTDSQIKGDSLQEQKETLESYVADNDDLITHDIYVDGGVSGQKIDRDEFTRLLGDVKNGKIDLIIFTKLDRWFRSLKHYLNTQDLLVKHNVEWLSVSQPFFNTDTAHGRAFVANSMTWAELEAQMASERIKAVFNNKVARGEVISGNAPIGYSIVDKHLVPNEDAEKVQLIFEHYSVHNNLNRTIQYMEHELGIIRTQPILKRILREKKYIGEFRGNLEYCEPIIEKELFFSIQDKLGSNIKKNSNRVYPFSGLIRCDSCGRLFAGGQKHSRLGEDGKRTTINSYRCHTAWVPKRCDNKYYITEYLFEEKVLGMIKPLIKKYINNSESTPAKRKKATVNKNDIRKKMDRLKAAYLNEIISLDEFKKDRESLEKILENSIEKEQPKDFTALKDLLELDLTTFYPDFTPEEKQQFWRSFIKEILIDKEGNLSIFFK